MALHAKTSSEAERILEARSEEERGLLWAITWALLMICVVTVICFLGLLSRTRPTPQSAAEILPVCDKMLLTAAEREKARRSNVGSYTFDGMHYVNASLPEEYWTEWRSNDG